MDVLAAFEESLEGETPAEERVEVLVPEIPLVSAFVVPWYRS